MILCPVCKHLEYHGALFCSECGESLIAWGESGQQKPVSAEKNAEQAEVLDFPGNIGNIYDGKPVGSICIQVIESGDVYFIEKHIPVIIGRSAKDQPVLPDIDLSNQNAYSFGVSRLHVEMAWEDDGVYISDLGSANGTKLNGIPISPHNRVRINIGDTLDLGMLHIKITAC